MCIHGVLAHPHQRPLARQRTGPISAESSLPLGSTDVLAAARMPRQLGGLSARVLTGCVLGGAGALSIIAGGIPFLCIVEFFVYNCIQEFFGFVAAVGQREGRPPPPAWATALITLCCMSLPLYTFLANGKIALGLALASFATCSVLVTTTEAPKLSTLTSAIFGLLYCGAHCRAASCLHPAVRRRTRFVRAVWPSPPVPVLRCSSPF